MSTVAVIGSGFSGLSAACTLAQAGLKVTVIERHATPGGRARKFEAKGFTFDMGPSWYWMPDVFERFFHQFGKKPSDYYTLQRLDPSYRVVYAQNDVVDVPAGSSALRDLFESIEPGAGAALTKYLAEAELKYALAMGDLVYRPGLALSELMDPRLWAKVPRMHLFRSMRKLAAVNFKDPRLRQLIEFPVLFLGAKPSKTPALYSLMNYADMSLGTWYPHGGIYEVVKAMESLALSLGVTFRYNNEVTGLNSVPGGVALSLANGSPEKFDYALASADYHHVEQTLLPQTQRRYSPQYWDTRVLAPSCLIFYLGVNRKVNGLLHHNLFFDSDFDRHSEQIYDRPEWPSSPQFYVCCPSKTDHTVAPPGMENIFVLIPVAPGLSDSSETRKHYFEHILTRMQRQCDIDRSSIVYQRSYAPSDFSREYHAFKGNAYGLANTLLQTSFGKPSIINKKFPNLFYAGQLTVPGPGVPPAIISGELAATQLLKRHTTAGRL